ncbi:DUF1127 domain-containing protein [Sulfitobacter sp. LCG007]
MNRPHATDGALFSTDHRHGAASRLYAFWQALREWHRRRQDYARLQELPGYLLDDVGLTHWQIEAAKRNNRL